MEFLSCQSIEMHRKYLDKLKLKLSVFEASYPSIVGEDYHCIDKTRIPRDDRERILGLKSEIEAHEIYFISFLESGASCEKNEIISKQYGSEAKFLYELMRYASGKGGFLFIYFNRAGCIRAYAGENYLRALRYFDVRLAVDLCEHAYFTDYGFDKEKYLSKALSSLNLSKLN